MDRFEEGFTAALTEFVRGTARPFDLQSSWDYLSVAAPERHVALGTASDIYLDGVVMQLMNYNPRFDMIGAVLHVYVTKESLRALAGAAIDADAEQVWMFGSHWFNKYYEHLLEAKTLRSEFYRTRHHEFLALLARMCAVNPGARPSFRAALESWYPSSDALTQSQSADADDAESPIAAPHAACDSDAPPRRRLVLVGWGGRAARNKTRRNLNS